MPHPLEWQRLPSELLKAADIICSRDSTEQGPAMTTKSSPPMVTPPTGTRVPVGFVARDANCHDLDEAGSRSGVQPSAGRSLTVSVASM